LRSNRTPAETGSYGKPSIAALARFERHARADAMTIVWGQAAAERAGKALRIALPRVGKTRRAEFRRPRDGRITHKPPAVRIGPLPATLRYPTISLRRTRSDTLSVRRDAARSSPHSQSRGASSIDLAGRAGVCRLKNNFRPDHRIGKLRRRKSGAVSSVATIPCADQSRHP